MAHRIKAINAYRPRLEQGNTVQKPELVRAVSRSTGIAEGTLDHSIKELRDQITEYCRAGRAVKVIFNIAPTPPSVTHSTCPAPSAAPFVTANSSAKPAMNSSPYGTKSTPTIR